MGFIFYAGSLIVEHYGECPANVYISIFIMYTSASSCSMSLSNIPGIAIAKAAANSVFGIIDERSTLDPREGEKARIQRVEQGEIEFIDVNFRYPSRKQNRVLRQMTFKIPARTKIALVGGSGCGKSTITNLLLRFYDFERGQILIDGSPIKDFNVKKLREDIGFVMQEPILFNQTIKENILYGRSDATDFDVRKAALQANALQFIETEIENLDKEERIKKVSDDAKL